MCIRKKIRINFEKEFLQFGVPVVKLKSGEEEMCFLVDTGASESIIDVSMLDKKILFQELETENELQLIGLGGSENVTQAGYLAINVDNILLPHVFYAFDCSSINVKQGDLKFNAILGSDFFRKYQVIINFKDKQLILVKKLNLKKTLKNIMKPMKDKLKLKKE